MRIVFGALGEKWTDAFLAHRPAASPRPDPLRPPRRREPPRPAPPVEYPGFGKRTFNAFVSPQRCPERSSAAVCKSKGEVGWSSKQSASHPNGFPLAKTSTVLICGNLSKHIHFIESSCTSRGPAHGVLGSTNGLMHVCLRCDGHKVAARTSVFGGLLGELRNVVSHWPEATLRQWAIQVLGSTGKCLSKNKHIAWMTMGFN